MNATTISALSYKLLIIGFLAAFLAACSDTDETTTYRVTFDTDDGTPAVDDKTLESGEKVPIPTPNPTKPDSVFSVWINTATGQEYNFADPVTANLDLKATYTIKAYTVTFDTDGGTPTLDDRTVKSGDQAAKPTPDPTKPDSVFTSWINTANNQTYDFSAPVTSNLNLKAVYAKAHKVTFEADGGNPAPSEQTIVQGQRVQEPPPPRKSGFDFVHWVNTENNAEYVFSTLVTSNLNLKATYTIQRYEVKFNTNGGGMIESVEVDYGQTIEEPDPPTRENKIFAGWHTDERSNTPYDFNTPVTGDMTLYAQWSDYNIPDPNFRAFLQQKFPNAFDGEQLKTDDSAVKDLETLDVSSQKIASLEGIQYFTGLTKLDCRNTNLSGCKQMNLREDQDNCNSLIELDVSQNTNLKELNCSGNELTSLNVSGLTALMVLNCSFNKLSALDISSASALTELYCQDNELSALDASNKKNLKLLRCFNNALTSLGISGATALEDLDCAHNKLTSLDVSGSSKLARLSCRGNQLTSLDMRNNGGLSIRITDDTSDPAERNNELAEIFLHQSLLCNRQIQLVVRFNKARLDMKITSYGNNGEFIQAYGEDAYERECPFP